MGPIEIGTPGTYVIKAFAKKDNMGPSQVVSQTYTIQGERVKEVLLLLPPFCDEEEIFPFFPQGE